MELASIFGTEKNIIIGAIHLPPSPGYEGCVDLAEAQQNALWDLHAFQDGGATAVIFENNYDIPHTEEISEEARDFMEKIGTTLLQEARIPVGVSVLWNDYRSALTISKKIGLRFIRIPVFVDTVRTQYGTFSGSPQEVLDFRKEIGAENIALFTDIHVKHAEILSNSPLIESGKEAIRQGSDALIITGKWTGDAPDLEELSSLRHSVGEFPILCGSGVDHSNIAALFRYANGAIVSTALKDQSHEEHAINIRPYDSRIIKDKVKKLMESLERSK